MKRIAKLGKVGLPIVFVLAAGACTGVIDDAGRVVSGSLQPFESCDAALAQLQYAAKTNLDDYEASLDDGWFEKDPGTVEDTAESAPDSEPTGEHSETNVQVEGVDEPDIVKTDGKRILTVTDDTFVVVDAKTQKQTHTIDLPDHHEVGNYTGSYEPQMLVHGDRALVIMQTREDYWPNQTVAPASNARSTLVMIDLSGEPDIVNTFEFEGAFVDGRGFDHTARLVMRSSPQFETQDRDEIRDAIDDSVIEDWLPKYRVNGETKQVGCEDLARPADYSAASTLTILTFDLTAALDDGDPLSIEADGETVYSTADAMYVANDRREFMTRPMLSGESARETTTEIYRFDIEGSGTPTHESTAKVPGYLLNQYSMSEHDGHLRVATTIPGSGSEPSESGSEQSSSVYVLKIGDGVMERVGEVNGLGVEERIFAVRFMGDKGYVVTFRQTDPLYTIDLSDPKNPQMTGELKITGYSAYLHPVLEDRLIGVGQEADTSGGRMGLQVSLFDISNDSKPDRIDQYHVPGEASNIEVEPHAFLYWEPDSLLFVPTNGSDPKVRVLKVESDQVTEEAVIDHSSAGVSTGVERTLIVDDTVWSLSKETLIAHDRADYSEEAQVYL